ncbi:MAG: hypothetical protein IBX46_10780 [Desulfuromonadales bacterium]|nr:hypothetical protein [Desulfuromonadales bacterium]
MIYSEYAKFCLAIGYKILETSNSVWIGPRYGFFSRMPLYETTPPQKQELEFLYHQHRILGVNYAAESGCKGKVSHNYFIRDRTYNLKNLSTNCRRNVQKGLKSCQVRTMAFDELCRLGMPLNLDTLNRQGRSDQFFSNKDQWKRLCEAGKELEQIEVWGAFVQNELASYIITTRLGPVVSVLFSHSRTSLLSTHASPALYFSMIQKLMQRPGVEAIYNGTEWLTTSKGLDRFKQGMGFIAEPVVLVTQLRPLANRILLSRGMRRTISFLGPLLLKQNFHQRIEAVLEMAELSS